MLTDRSGSAGFSCCELLFVLSASLILSTVSAIIAADSMRISKLKNQSKEIEYFLSGALCQSVNRQSILTLYFSSGQIKILDYANPISQLNLSPGISVENLNKPGMQSWIEELYPSGVQTPYTISIHNEKDICLITASLRGRIISKCFWK